jgi:hypothetical protein
MDQFGNSSLDEDIIHIFMTLKALLGKNRGWLIR